MLANFADRTWLWLAAEFYLVGFLLGTWSLLRGGRPLNVAMYALIVAGYAMQLTGLYLRGMAVPRSPKDLLQHRLVHLEGRYDPDTRWEVWLKKQGVYLEEPLRGIRVNAYTNLVQAALDGLGIALLGPPAISELLWKGSLVPLLRRRATKRRAFFLCVPSAGALTPAAQTFFEWVQREIKKRRIAVGSA